MDDVSLERIMTRDVITIVEEEKFSKVVDVFHKYNIRHLPVVDPARRLTGIITQRDLYKIVSPRRTFEGDFVYDKDDLDNFILKFVMTREVVTLHPNDPLRKLLKLMIEKKYGCIPIVDRDRKLVGIVTQIDVLRFLAKSMGYGIE